MTKTTKEILNEFKHHFYIDNLKKKYTIDEYKDMEIILQTNSSKSNVLWYSQSDLDLLRKEINNIHQNNRSRKNVIKEVNLILDKFSQSKDKELN